MRSMKITSPVNFNTESIVFDDPKINEHKDLNIPVNVRHSDGTLGPILLPLPKLFSYGISQRMNPDFPEKIHDFSMSLIFNRCDKNSAHQTIFLDAYDSIYNKCWEHMANISSRYGINLGTKKLEEKLRGKKMYTQILNMVESSGRMKRIPDYMIKFYPKLPHKVTEGKVTFPSPKIYDVSNGGVDIPPLSLINKKCIVHNGTIIINHYMISNGIIYLHPTLYDANIEVLDQKPKLAGTFSYDNI